MLNLKLNLLVVLIFSSISVFSQKTLNKESKISIAGTSNVHDWTIQATSFNGTLNASTTSSLEINSLSLSIVVEKLVSGKQGMDKNTYKALKSHNFKTIEFKLTKVISLKSQGQGKYHFEGQGTLTVAGVTKSINLNANIEIKDNQVIFKGKHKLNMKTFDIEPPKALLGTIKTGEEVTIEFNAIYQ